MKKNNLGKTLVIASHNEGKVTEIRDLLKKYDFEIISAKALNLPEPEENAKTFIGNAEIKSISASKISKFSALSDDSGLVVPALNGQPGIYSARWAEPDKNFKIAMDKVKIALIDQNIDPNKNIVAYFVCVLSLAMPNGLVKNFTGRSYGVLQFPPKGDNGFGYDAIFCPSGYDKTFAELGYNIKKDISHRSEAFKKLQAYLKETTE